VVERRRETISSGFACEAIERAKENWRRFKESEPGHRFQNRYRRHQENRRGKLDPRTFLSIGGGILIVVEGLVACPDRVLAESSPSWGWALSPASSDPLHALWAGPR
jgi:hypothetical protein